MTAGRAEGLNVDVPYTDDVHPELSPEYPSPIALLQGARPPRVDRPFRYRDLGCGRGSGPLRAAAVETIIRRRVPSRRRLGAI